MGSNYLFGGIGLKGFSEYKGFPRKGFYNRESPKGFSSSIATIGVKTNDGAADKIVYNIPRKCFLYRIT